MLFDYFWLNMRQYGPNATSFSWGRIMLEVSGAYFIRLGRDGRWVSECLRKGMLRFGYEAIPNEICLAGDWKKAWEIWFGIRKDKGATTRDINQVRWFYESDGSDIFITFANSQMYWCRPSGPVVMYSTGDRSRSTEDGWHNKSLRGAMLSFDRLPTNILKTNGYRGTICRVGALSELLNLINDK